MERLRFEVPVLNNYPCSTCGDVRSLINFDGVTTSPTLTASPRSRMHLSSACGETAKIFIEGSPRHSNELNYWMSSGHMKTLFQVIFFSRGKANSALALAAERPCSCLLNREESKCNDLKYHSRLTLGNSFLSSPN